jgi:hypothetical protein
VGLRAALVRNKHLKAIYSEDKALSQNIEKRKLPQSKKL